VSALEVPLESILACFQGVIPSPFATCAADGTPNITYLSIVRYVDSERVAVSRQFLNKTRANLDANPRGQVLVVDPETLQDYLLDLRYLHTETEGTVFEEMRANLDAVASQAGMGDVFRLRGVDIHRVERCRRGPGSIPEPPGERGVERNTLRHLDDFVRRLASCSEYEEAVRTALVALDDLLGFDHSILLAAEEGAERLFAVADHGYPRSWSGAEVAVGEGLIGVAAERRQVVAVANLARNRSMRRGVERSLERQGGQLARDELPLPGTEDARSAAAVPLVVHGTLTGVLYLESEAEGRFGPQNERLLRILAAHVSTTLAACAQDRSEAPSIRAADATPAVGQKQIAVAYYQADDSLFVDDEYLVKGVPARILWKLLREHESSGRTEFTNRELRLDEGLGLPAGADNLEARLLVLRRRLEGERWPLGLERVGRGRLKLTVPGPLELTEVPTGGPMKAAHPSPSEPE
jgi:adenylate cyclase